MQETGANKFADTPPPLSDETGKNISDVSYAGKSEISVQTDDSETANKVARLLNENDDLASLGASRIGAHGDFINVEAKFNCTKTIIAIHNLVSEVLRGVRRNTMQVT